MKYSTASQLKSELKSGLSQKKLSVADRTSKGEKLIEEYVPQLEKTNKGKAEAYKVDIQKLINKLHATPQSETVKSSDNEINDIDKEPLEEEPQMKEPEVKGPEVKEPEETMELNHKRKTPKDSQEEPELAVYKRSLELEYEKRRRMDAK